VLHPSFQDQLACDPGGPFRRQAAFFDGVGFHEFFPLLGIGEIEAAAENLMLHVPAIA